MSRKELIALFKMFLEMNDALEGYLKGLNTPRAKISTGRSPFDHDYCISGIHYRGEGTCYLVRAFRWLETEEGSTYWHKLAIKWDKVLKDVNNNS